MRTRRRFLSGAAGLVAAILGFLYPRKAAKADAPQELPADAIIWEVLVEDPAHPDQVTVWWSRRDEESFGSDWHAWVKFPMRCSRGELTGILDRLHGRGIEYGLLPNPEDYTGNLDMLRGRVDEEGPKG